MWNMKLRVPRSMPKTQRRDAEDGARGAKVFLSLGAPNEEASFLCQYLNIRLRVTRRAGGLRPGHYHLSGHETYCRCTSE